MVYHLLELSHWLLSTAWIYEAHFILLFRIFHINLLHKPKRFSRFMSTYVWDNLPFPNYTSLTCICAWGYKKLLLDRLLFYSISYFLKHHKFSVYGQCLSGIQEQAKKTIIPNYTNKGKDPISTIRWHMYKNKWNQIG